MEDTPSRPDIEHMHVLTNLTIYKIEEIEDSSEYHVYGKKNGNTYRFNVTEDQFDDIKNIYTEYSFDVMYSQGIYAEKTAIGISLSSNRN